MNDIEFKFLEVFYNRGIVPEQSFVNYLNGSLPESLENKKEFIDTLFTKFNNYGFIHTIEPGAYQITDLGKEKYEELTERKDMNRKLDDLKSRQSRYRKSTAKFWAVLIIVIIIVSMLTSALINRWPQISRILHFEIH
jgi:hypothetical protein